MIFSESFGKSVLVIYRLGKSVLVKVSSYYLKFGNCYKTVPLQVSMMTL